MIRSAHHIYLTERTDLIISDSSTPPQKRQLVASYYSSKYCADGVVGESTFSN